MNNSEMNEEDEGVDYNDDGGYGEDGLNFQDQSRDITDLSKMGLPP